MNPPNDNLLIIGAGQYGLMAFEIAQAMGSFGEIAFLDDSYTAPAASPENVIANPEGAAIHVIGTPRDISQFAADFRCGFVAIGNPQIRARLIEHLKSNGITLATLIHPTAYVSPSAQLQTGCCVEPLAVVQTGAFLGTATFVASGAVIRHNAIVGDFCHIDCNAVVLTGATVPNDTKVPCNTVFGTGFAP